jgi:hypothetical protein
VEEPPVVAIADRTGAARSRRQGRRVEARP